MLKDEEKDVLKWMWRCSSSYLQTYNMLELMATSNMHPTISKIGMKIHAQQWRKVCVKMDVKMLKFIFLNL
jgi:hypothetical protein